MGFKVSGSKKSSNLAGYLFISALVLIILAAIGTVGYKFAFGAKPNDVRTLCPADGPLGHVVLLVDKSDPMTFTQRKDFDVLYKEVVTSIVPKGHLLSVYALADDFASTAEPLLELCNPGDGSDASQFNANPVQLRKMFDEKYAKPMFELREDLTTNKPGKSSPILEMVQLAGITGFRKHAVSGERRMIIVSDMIHFTKQLDMYKSVPKYESFIDTPYGRKTLADLDGAKIEIRMLLNTPSVQNENLLGFWQQHIKQSGGRIVLHQPIKG
jgi:hypothetical protein